jgi:hypothetical protein
VYHSTLIFSWYYTYTIAKTTLPTLDLCVLTASNLDMTTPSYNIISNAIFDSSNITTSFEFQSPVSSIYPAMYSLSLDYSSQINDSSSQDLSSIGFRTKTLYLYNMQGVVGSGQLSFIKNFSSYTPLETIIISGLDNPGYNYRGNNNFIDFSNITSNPYGVPKNLFIVDGIHKDLFSYSNPIIKRANCLSDEAINRYFWFLYKQNNVQQQYKSIGAVTDQYVTSSNIKNFPNGNLLLDSGWNY